MTPTALSKSCIMLFSIFVMLLSRVWTVASSAYKSEEQWSKWSGKSLIYIRNNVGSNINPCGTPESTSEKKSVSPFSLSMACWR